MVTCVLLTEHQQRKTKREQVKILGSCSFRFARLLDGKRRCALIVALNGNALRLTYCRGTAVTATDRGAVYLDMRRAADHWLLLCRCVFHPNARENRSNVVE